MAAQGRRTGLSLPRSVPTPVGAGVPELLYARPATRFFALVHLAAGSQLLFWSGARVSWQGRGSPQLMAVARASRSSLTYTAWSLWQDTAPAAPAAQTPVPEVAAPVPSASTLAPARTRTQVAGMFIAIGALFVGAIELFAARSGTVPHGPVHPLTRHTHSHTHTYIHTCIHTYMLVRRRLTCVGCARSC
jgi:hypothetical protein